MAKALKETSAATWALPYGVFGQLKNGLESINSGEKQHVIIFLGEKRHTRIVTEVKVL